MRQLSVDYFLQVGNTSQHNDKKIKKLHSQKTQKKCVCENAIIYVSKSPNFIIWKQDIWIGILIFCF